MRTFSIISIAFALGLGVAVSAHAEGFLGVYEDLPLAPGLAEVQGSGLTFDSPGGRIVEGYAKGAVKAADILKFYATTLPQLGWTRESDSQYRREAEVLKLDTEADGRALVVHFTISPE
ncbi:MAG: hypothetical protein NVV74_06715 [Magnetospirillum sp.]|nr:hypothetical protein [Magnetospirillum sp.]